MNYNTLFEHILFLRKYIEYIIITKDLRIFFLFLSLQKEIKVNNYADRSQ